MKKLFSAILAITLLLTIMPLQISIAAQTEPSDYWLDRDAEDGYLGNYTLISNDGADSTKYYDIGDVTGNAAPASAEAVTTRKSSSEPVTDGDGVIRMTVSTQEAREINTRYANQTHEVGDSHYWYFLENPFEMDQDYVTVTGQTYSCRAKGQHCYVWTNSHTEAESIQIKGEEAQKICDEFDRIFSSMLNNFGSFDAPGADTKVNIMVHNLPDGISSYFYDFEFTSLGNNEGQYFFHLDNLGTIVDAGGNWDVTVGYKPMVSAFCDMLVYLRSHNGTPEWLTQVIRQAAVNLIYGTSDTKEMIANWAENTKRYTEGRSMFDWVKAELTESPAYLNVFAEYLKAHCGSYEVFGEILDAYAAQTDTTGATLVPQALAGTVFDGMTLGEISMAYRLALIIKDKKADSIYGFGGNKLFDDIPVTYTSGEGITRLYGGGSIVVKNLSTGIFTPAEGSSNKIKYVGITVDIDALPTVNCVIFKDYDGTFMKEQLVFNGKDAVPPEDPYHPGMTFAGWDKPYTNIQSSVTITATYSQGETYHTVTFLNEDNHEQINQIRIIRSFKLGIIDKPVRPGYAFIGWYLADGTEFDPVNTKIYDDITVYARYISAVTIYSYAFTAWGFSSFSTDKPEDLSIYSDADDNVRYLFAGSYLNSKLYGFNDLKNFISIDPDNYKATVIKEAGSNDSVKNIYVFLDMTYDYSTQTMYVSYIDTSYGSHLGKVDLATGVVTSIATPSEYYMALACTKDGKLYGMLSRGIFVSVNKTNGRYTVIGDTGIDLEAEGYITYTCMTIDYNTGILYWSAENHEDGNHHIYMIYPESGRIVDLGVTGGNYQLHAMYIPYNYDIATYYTVNFVDWDGSVIDSQQVAEGHDAVAPADPEREGYVFTGWDKDFTNVHSDLRVMAQYDALAEYTVTFADWDFSVIDTQTVYEGHDAVAPADPVRTGYTFTGWDKDFTNVHSNLIVVAQYVEGTVVPTTPPTDDPVDGIIGDANGDGTVNTADAVTVLKYAAEMIQLSDTQLRLADVNRNGTVNTSDATVILRYAAGIITEF